MTIEPLMDTIPVVKGKSMLSVEDESVLVNEHCLRATVMIVLSVGLKYLSGVLRTATRFVILWLHLQNKSGVNSLLKVN